MPCGDIAKWSKSESQEINYPPLQYAFDKKKHPKNKTKNPEISDLVTHSIESSD